MPLSTPCVKSVKLLDMRLKQSSRCALKKERIATPVKGGKSRAPASVDREVQLLSRIFNLAIERGEFQTNPCKGSSFFANHNQVTRYLSYEDEEKLMPFLTGSRAHVMRLVIPATCLRA